MTNRPPNYRSVIISFARGQTPVHELPFEDQDFWESVFVRAARPGRRSLREPFLGAAAEHLLRRELYGASAEARRLAARRAVSHPNKAVRRLAVKALENAPTKEDLEALRHAALDPDPEVGLTAVRIISEQPTVSSVSLLADLLGLGSDARSGLAATGLVRAGPSAIPFLVGLLNSADTRTRWRAVECLVKIRHPSGLDALLRAMHDDSTDVAWLAVDGLLALGPSVAHKVLASTLEAPLTESGTRALRHYAEHANPHAVFQAIVEATAGLGVRPAALVAVEEALKILESGGQH
jgi:HEAT repeat protein